MPSNESSLRVYLMGKFYSKVIYQKCMFFTNIRNNYSLKDYPEKMKKILLILHRRQIKQIYVEDFTFKVIRHTHHTNCN